MKNPLCDPAFTGLADDLKIPVPHAIGLVYVLIKWTRLYCPEDFVGKWDNHLIAIGCGWTGDSDAFVGALVANNWLVEKDGSLFLNAERRLA